MISVSQDFCNLCSFYIFQCLKQINIINISNKRVNFVIGILYLMKRGLVIHNKQLLPQILHLNYCLPHEINLEKLYQLSMKLICETENELKMTLRNK